MLAFPAGQIRFSKQPKHDLAQAHGPKRSFLLTDTETTRDLPSIWQINGMYQFTPTGSNCHTSPQNRIIPRPIQPSAAPWLFYVVSCLIVPSTFVVELRNYRRKKCRACRDGNGCQLPGILLAMSLISGRQIACYLPATH